MASWPSGLDVQPGQTLLIRGGTSAVGLTAATLAKRRGLTVLATTRSEAKAGALREAGDDMEHDRVAGKLVVTTGR